MIRFLICLLVCGSLVAEEKPTICLNMIVKDESHVITRCLESMKPLIDYWVILDTGSTDGTQEIIQEFMKDVPGELHEDPFRNFEYSRNKALDLAKGKADYIFFIDADETLVRDEGFVMPKLDKDFYHVEIVNQNMNYVRRLIIKDGLDWRWVGVLHEVVVSDKARTGETLRGVHVPFVAEGARSQNPNKFQDDAKLLEEALAKDPGNSRYTFYLAQTYRDGGEPEKAIAWYQKRIDLGGWEQEVFWAQLQIALIKQGIGRPADEFITDFFKAYQIRPSRAEPLYHIARHYRIEGNYLAAYAIASAGCALPPTTDILFANKWMSDYGLILELSVSAYWLGKYAEAKLYSMVLLAKPNLPEHIQELVKKNLAFSDERLAEIQSSQTQD